MFWLVCSIVALIFIYSYNWSYITIKGRNYCFRQYLPFIPWSSAISNFFTGDNEIYQHISLINSHISNKLPRLRIELQPTGLWLLHFVALSSCCLKVWTKLLLFNSLRISISIASLGAVSLTSVVSDLWHLLDHLHCLLDILPHSSDYV